MSLKEEFFCTLIGGVLVLAEWLVFDGRHSLGLLLLGLFVIPCVIIGGFFRWLFGAGR